MNTVEIADAVADLAVHPFEAAEFPFQFMAAFDKKETQLKRLRKGDTNRSDVPGGVLLQSSIHLAVCAAGETHGMLGLLKTSPATTKAKAKFILATDGQTLEAEELSTGEAIASEFPKFADHIGFFLPLAGISTVREIKDNPIDVRATGRLNKLYVELLRQNPEWGTDARRHDMNHFMARLIFCFFAEDTDIFNARGRFTQTIEQFSESDGSNTHAVTEACFRAMNAEVAKRAAAGVPAYADVFPYVNGGLFAGPAEVPRFTRIARSYLLQAGSLDWQHINPDIFGSMIQAVADKGEREQLGMHYTSVPNILKVLNPLLLDELRAQLVAAGDNPRTLLNLRKRLSRIRVFDPACGSGNFLVIAYKELRKIEAEINVRRGEHTRGTEISKKNFRGIELRDFAAEIARLALVIAEYQCDVLHRGPLAAKEEFLPLDEMNWITCGNALSLDWREVCPPEGTQVRVREEGKLPFDAQDAKEIDFENDGGETFVCGNPPYKGGTQQSPDQKLEMASLFSQLTNSWASLDYVAAWLLKAAQYSKSSKTACGFVTTNSVTQGEQVARLWPLLLTDQFEIRFAHTSFKWANNATQRAGVTVVILGLGAKAGREALLFEQNGGKTETRRVANINPYLVAFDNLFVGARASPIASIAPMTNGSKAVEGGHLLLGPQEARALKQHDNRAIPFVRPFLGSQEAINGEERYCLWITPEQVQQALAITEVARRVDKVREFRRSSKKKLTFDGHLTPYAFQQIRQTGNEGIMIVPRVSSENRPYLPVALGPDQAIVSDLAFVFFDAPLWNMALVASKLHIVWIATVCGKLETRYRYSNTLGWNTFPVPPLTEQDKADLTRCAEDILLAREAHFPASIADLYDPEIMPENLRAAHDRNDETLERIYIGRRFKNDTERLETLFAMYAKMTEGTGAGIKGPSGVPRGRKKKEVQA
jgi:hypothetical protein